MGFEKKPATVAVRVVLRASEQSGLRIDRTYGFMSSAVRKAFATELSRQLGDAVAVPCFDDDALVGLRGTPCTRWFAVHVFDLDSGERIARQLRAIPEIELAYVESGPTPPPAVQPTDDPRSMSQGYLDAAPDGIDARWAWTRTDGKGSLVVDIEQGWVLDHDDLAGAGIVLISGLNAPDPETSQNARNHGTAVLGQLLAVDNSSFGIGIAPAATGRAVSQWRNRTVNGTTLLTYDTASAVLAAAQVMNRGDILLLEAQRGAGGTVTDSNGNVVYADYLPVETEDLVFDAIRTVVDLGITVIEAAGNGRHTLNAAGVSFRLGIDLDSWTDSAGNLPLNRESDQFRDSGAIMVGAGASAAPHGRLEFSNHGTRIDCYGWGENVYTLGYGMGVETKRETFGFGGTSSASPIVAGAALLIQSWIRSWGKGYSPYDPAELRSLLSDPAINTQSADPGSDRIGVMPNLRGIIEPLEQRMKQVQFPKGKLTNYWAARVLLGLLDGTPGLVWEPGKPPIPVDPGRTDLFPDPSKRDLLLAMAVHELAGTVEQPEARVRMQATALEAMQMAVRGLR